MNGPGTAAESPAAPPEPGGTGLHLIDKSAWEQRHHHPAAAARLDDLVGTDRAATCLTTALEILYSARSRRDFGERRELVNELAWLPVTAPVEATAVEIMAKLARTAQHRLPPTDLIIAATALVHEATVLHYDRDFERIAEVTNLCHEWIVPRGTGHRRDGRDSG